MPQGNLPGDRASTPARLQSSPRLPVGPYPLQVYSQQARCREADTSRDRLVKSWNTVPGPGQTPGYSRPRGRRQHKGPREIGCTPPVPPLESSRQATRNTRTSPRQACVGAAPQIPPASTDLLAPRHFWLQFAPGREDRYPRSKAMTYTARGAPPRAQGSSSRRSPSAGARRASYATPRHPSGSRKPQAALLSACCAV